MVIQEVIAIWKDYDPVEGYAAGFDDCKGRMFTPTDREKADILRRIENARSGLAEIRDEELRKAANKLLSSINVAIAYDSPEEQVLGFSIALWYAILKGEQGESFVGKLLEQALEILEFEHSRWQDHKFSGEVRKACVDACSFLEAILITLASESPALVGAINELSMSVANFRSLFSFPVRHPDSFEELLAFLEANSCEPSENRLYPQMIEHLFDYGVTVEEIYSQSRRLLGEELALAKDVISSLGSELGVAEGASLGDAYETVSRRYEIEGAVVEAAQKMMEVLNRFVDGYIQDLGVQPDILPEATPAFLKPLVTSGATVALDYMKERPSVRIYVTEEKNTSWLTMLNVLVHEAAHAYNPSILAGVSSVPTLTKLKSWLAIPFYEATAFHRELELFEAIKEESQHPQGLGKIQQELLEMFDTPRFPLRDDVMAFELETRVWRIIRALRTICDVEVNTGKRTYVDFIRWASAHTGLTKEFIHNECFTFLSSPGYTPSYSFCGSLYSELQKEAAEQRGVSRFSFNTQANHMGLLPWTLAIKRMSRFLPQ